MQCINPDFMRVLCRSNLQLAEDALGLLNWATKEGVLERAQRKLVPYGSRDFRVYTGLYALADTVFQQANENDEKAFDLYDALILAWPDKRPSVTAEFERAYLRWRLHSPYDPEAPRPVADLSTYRRVHEFVGSCE